MKSIKKKTQNFLFSEHKNMEKSFINQNFKS